MQAVRTKAEVLSQKEKLVNSYNELLQEFSSPDLRSVGNYTLGRLIGKGSFGKVYLATHKLTNNSKVVLKSSNKQDSNLAREIHHHRQFLHPHIARLYEVIITENLVWLVLEYCPGDELYNHILNNGPLVVDKARRIFAQLVGAVAYVHSKSCVHRDLKLENILLDKHGNVKLCDFGFTREYEGKASYLQTFCGTICYSAPEMLKGEKYAGEKVDVWSLGIILYALLAGELPYDEDDDQETKAKILKEDPVFNDKFPDDSQALIKILLSKRPLLRPTLADILAHPFLAEHGVEQQIILQAPRPSPFTTPLEKATLLRMKSAGVNIDQVIEHVLAQRCDALAGWWALLIEKEERKEKRRERRRKEKEAEARSLRRLSAASSRLEKISALVEVDEEAHSADTLQTRGRRDRRSLPNPELSIPEVPKVPEAFANLPALDIALPPQPIDKDSIRSLSSTRRRPVPPPKENRRPSMLHVSASQPELASHSSGLFRRRTGRRNQHSLMSQLASLKHWIVESAKRAKSPHPRTPKSTGGQSSKARSEKSSPGKNSDTRRKQVAITSTSTEPPLMTPTQVKRSSNASSLAPNSASYAHHRNSYGRAPRSSNSHRNSLSPAPLTPRGSYRRSSAGLRGRKSTSSSVSSVRSIYHAHTHSKASSISSNSIDTMSTPTASSRMSRSPHTSVKVLPAIPNAGARFPSNIRLVRNPPNALRDVNDPNNHGIYSVFNEAVSGPSTAPPQSPGFIFARRKRTPFRGPMLHTNTLMFTNGPGTPNLSPPLQRDVASTETVKPHTRKSQIIEEEDDDMEEDIEEVDTFSDPGITDTSFTAMNEPLVETETDADLTIVVAPSEETLEEISHEPSLEPAMDPSSPIPPRISSLNDPEVQLQTNEATEEDPSARTPELEPAPDATEDIKTPTTEDAEHSTQHEKPDPTSNDELKQDTPITS
ncbi:serine/threonine protein kinase, putative [Talaromyces stipitatus ATCC 10500]|uniref:Serine/threonine protein kinase, putative n=1 Tax=Talaromyces stipitatus (strain ATCC 10500 / CBS 375.48 / QM 6759 / NRRL 1006) TaxID=441959 RepID=B8MKE2_TALSN|nr:serine/threonine protein kinase, putative [Talaromyces stipitatus ATCC 10500]EED15297.1 serine/threonine protein kinase, putative [Talaromyces stipitatus ATCC 10500]